MKTNKVQRFVFLLMVPAMLFFWGCSRYQIRQAFQAYSHKPGFALNVIHSDSLSVDDANVSKVISYLKDVKEVYILKFDPKKGDRAEDQKLCDRLRKYVSSDHFESLMDIEGRNRIGLYLKKDNQNNIDQVIFFKSGGKHSLYVWAPRAEN